MGSLKIKPQSTLLGKGYHLGKPQAAKNICLPDANRKGHMFCFGSTRIGKTKLIELMIAQDIRKGYSVTLFDPKGDIDLLSSVVQVAFEDIRLLLIPWHTILCPKSWYRMSSPA
jgi:conjugal transfer pilus assembly protein TraD